MFNKRYHYLNENAAQMNEMASV